MSSVQFPDSSDFFRLVAHDPRSQHSTYWWSHKEISPRGTATCIAWLPKYPRRHLGQKANLSLYHPPNHHSCVFMAPGELQSPQFWDCWTQKTPLLKVPSRWLLQPRPPDVHLGSHYFALCIILKVAPRVPCSVSATVPQSAFSHFSHGCLFSRMQQFSQYDYESLHLLLLLKSATSFPVCLYCTSKDYAASLLSHNHSHSIYTEPHTQCRLPTLHCTHHVPNAPHPHRPMSMLLQQWPCIAYTYSAPYLHYNALYSHCAYTASAHSHIVLIHNAVHT